MASMESRIRGLLAPDVDVEDMFAGSIVLHLLLMV